MHHSRGHSAPFGRSACTMAAVYVHHLARRIHLNEQSIIEPQVEDPLNGQLDFEDIIAEIRY